MVKRMLFALVCCTVIAPVVQADSRRVLIRGGYPPAPGPLEKVTARAGETVTFEAWVWQRNPNKKSPERWLPLPHVTIYWEVKGLKGVSPDPIVLGHTTKNGHVTVTFTIPESAKPCKNAKYVARFNGVKGQLDEASHNGTLTIEK
jgi:hypothetical protein